MEPLQVRFNPPSERPADDLFLAKQCLARARQAADLLLRESRSLLAERANRIRRRAREIGYEHGARSGREEGAKLLINYQRSYANTLRESEKECLALSLRIAEEVIGQELHVSPEGLLRRIREGLSTLREIRKLRIEVNRQDFVELGDSLHALAAETNGEVIPTECPRGFAKLITDAGTSELSISRHLERIALNLEQQVNSRQGSAK